MAQNSLFSFKNLQAILDSLNTNGKFEISVLTDLHGLPIASSSSSIKDAENQAAIVSQIQKLITQMGHYLGMDLTEEVSFNDVSGKKLVCRSFNLGGSEMVLTIMMDQRTKSYRRLTNKAIYQLQRVWHT